MHCLLRGVAALIAVAFLAFPAAASFHLMQIEQVIGGVNGDTSAQAIQLRMRTCCQNLLANQARLVAWDANGANPVVLFTFTANVTQNAAGTRILIASPNFPAQTSPAAIPNFTMTNLIPASYLAAGRITFETLTGSVYWSLAWGGAGYTGSTTGLTSAQGGNDTDGNFGPPFGSPLPGTSLQALQFTGIAGAGSTNNAANYAITPGAATFHNSSGTAFVVIGVPVGACCDGVTACFTATQAACAGTWLPGEPCSPDPCAPVGLCCAQDGACSMTTALDCDGQWLPVGSCEPTNPCAQPTGPCCLAAGGCTITDEVSCSGMWHADGTCASQCPSLFGACCVGAECTINVPEASCTGVWDAGNNCDISPGPPHSFCCPGNFNRDAVKDVADIFAGLGALFSFDPAIDWNHDHFYTLSDFFGFFGEWFTPC